MHRIARILALASLLSLVLPLAPARAAVARAKVVPCRSANDSCWPAAFAFTPDERFIVYAERLTGQIRMYNRFTKNDRLWRRVGDVATEDEQGVLGIAVDPEWPQQPWIYVYFTKKNPKENRIVRMRKKPGGGFQTQRLLSIPAAGFHNGGTIHFGPDGNLYAVTGDATQAARAQDTGTPAGKVLRMTRTGQAPGDNPIGGNVVFSFGHRNSFGFAFDPKTGRLWQTENGPECNDEINLVRKGRNHGWGGSSSCPNTNTSGPDPVGPRITINPVIAPTGAAFCDACLLGKKTNGALLFGAFNDRWIRRLTLTADRQGVGTQTLLFQNAEGILAVEAAPDGRVFFSDQNGIYRLKRT